MRWFLAILCLFLAAAGYPGTWIIESYSGGVASWTSPQGPGSIPYSGGGLGWGATINVHSIPATGLCSGSIETKLKWIPAPGTNEPPEPVIIAEFAAASWTGDSGSCSNGLGHPELNQISQGTRYTAFPNPGNTITLSCSPLVNVQASSSTGIGRIEANVLYLASAFQPKIVLNGTTLFGSIQKILIGQRLLATVDLDGLGASDVQYSWNVTGETHSRTLLFQRISRVENA